MDWLRSRSGRRDQVKDSCRVRLRQNLSFVIRPFETFFSDQKSRGFQLDRSHLNDPERVNRLLLAACLAYLWIIYLGTLASQPHWRRLVHRADRCDLSLFQLGLRLLDFWLEDDAPLRIAFLPQATQAQTLVFKSVR